MRVMRFADSGQMPALDDVEMPKPQPRAGELRVRVYAAGVTPTEVLWYPTTHTKDGANRTHAIPAHEFSGIVDAAGGETTGFKPGQEVYGMNDWFSDGALAEYCLTKPHSVALKPGRLTHVEAASVPIGALTAWQGLFDRAKLQGGERVLVHGGAGAVGLFAIQLALYRGAHVITTVSSRNSEFVSELGAGQVIDYRAVRFEEHVHDVDVVFDTVGGDTLERSWGVLKPGGRMITIAASSEETRDERAKQAFFIVEPNEYQLAEIGNLLDAGKLRTVVDGVAPFVNASAVYSGGVGQRLGRGKLVVSIMGDSKAASG